EDQRERALGFLLPACELTELGRLIGDEEFFQHLMIELGVWREPTLGTRPFPEGNHLLGRCDLHTAVYAECAEKSQCPSAPRGKRVIEEREHDRTRRSARRRGHIGRTGSTGLSLSATNAQIVGRGRGKGAVSGSCRGGSLPSGMLRSAGAEAIALSCANACTERGRASDFPERTTGSPAGEGDAASPPSSTRRTASGSGACGFGGGANSARLERNGRNSSEAL